MRLGASCGRHGASWDVLGTSRAVLGASWVRVGVVLGRLGAHLVPLRWSQKLIKTNEKSTFCCVGVSWAS